MIVYKARRKVGLIYIYVHFFSSSKMAAYTFSYRMLVVCLVVAWAMVGESTARELSESGSWRSSLVARLKLEEESSGCWESLMQIQSCTGEIISFFLNGETYLGPACCRAIHHITQQCWPTMTVALGFTSEESNVLQGYCDGYDHPHSPPFPLKDLSPSSNLPSILH